MGVCVEKLIGVVVEVVDVVAVVVVVLVVLVEVVVVVDAVVDVKVPGRFTPQA